MCGLLRMGLIIKLKGYFLREINLSQEVRVHYFNFDSENIRARNIRPDRNRQFTRLCK